MRQGQGTFEVHSLVSDPEIRLTLVPISEAEYETALLNSAQIEVPDNLQGTLLREKYGVVWQLVFACRQVRDHTERIWDYPEAMVDDLNPEDVNYLIDHYFEMIDQTSPSIDGVSEKELDDLKKALLEMDWSEVSGKSWYALKRFLLSLMPTPLGDSLLGYSSISKLTTTNDENESTPNA